MKKLLLLISTVVSCQLAAADMPIIDLLKPWKLTGGFALCGTAGLAAQCAEPKKQKKSVRFYSHPLDYHKADEEHPVSTVRGDSYTLSLRQTCLGQKEIESRFTQNYHMQYALRCSEERFLSKIIVGTWESDDEYYSLLTTRIKDTISKKQAHILTCCNDTFETLLDAILDDIVVSNDPKFASCIDSIRLRRDSVKENAEWVKGICELYCTHMGMEKKLSIYDSSYCKKKISQIKKDEDQEKLSKK